GQLEDRCGALVSPASSGPAASRAQPSPQSAGIILSPCPEALPPTPVRGQTEAPRSALVSPAPERDVLPSPQSAGAAASPGSSAVDPRAWPAERDDTLLLLQALHTDSYKVESEGFGLLKAGGRPSVSRRSDEGRESLQQLQLQQERQQQLQEQQLQMLQLLEEQQRSLFRAQDELREAAQRRHEEQREQQRELLGEMQRQLQEEVQRLGEMQKLAPSPAKGYEESVASRSFDRLPLSRKEPTPVASSNRRQWLILQVFRMLDLDEDGLLQQRELRGLADLMGFDGSDADWAQQYQQLCADMKVQKSQGFDVPHFTDLLNDEKGCPAADDKLFEALIELAGYGQSPGHGVAAVALLERLDGFSHQERQDFAATLGLDLERHQLVQGHGLPHFLRLTKNFSLAKLKSALAADVRSGHVLDHAAGSSSTARQDEAWHVESPAVQAKEKMRRFSLAHDLFAALDSDKDGALSCQEMWVFASLSGFQEHEAAWRDDYQRLCQQKGCPAGVTREIFLRLLEDRGVAGLYCSDYELQRLIGVLQARRSHERRVSTASTTSTQASQPVERSRLVDALFWYLDTDKDGLLQPCDLRKLVDLLGFQASDADWADEFQRMCLKHSASVVDLEVFRQLVNDGEASTFCEDAAMQRILARRFSRR
ncbi:unnamed protein product, partial [Effrenium voratum]